MLTGFRFAAERLAPATVRAILLWQDALHVYGLGWFAALCVGAIALLPACSATTAAAMGTMLACLIAGTILPRLAPSWEAQKYLFVTNLPLPDYFSGSPPPIAGLTVGPGPPCSRHGPWPPSWPRLPFSSGATSWPTLV